MCATAGTVVTKRDTAGIECGGGRAVGVGGYGCPLRLTRRTRGGGLARGGDGGEGGLVFSRGARRRDAGGETMASLGSGRRPPLIARTARACLGWRMRPWCWSRVWPRGLSMEEWGWRSLVVEAAGCVQLVERTGGAL